eukprot:4888066-Alexandrium_andersonii.AAC.1
MLGHATFGTHAVPATLWPAIHRQPACMQWPAKLGQARPATPLRRMDRQPPGAPKAAEPRIGKR